MKILIEKRSTLYLLFILCTLVTSNIHNTDYKYYSKKLNTNLNSKENLRLLELLPPPTSGQLLIDASVNNTTPSATDVFTYKIRYRYASTTEHGTNSNIELTFPDAYEIVQVPVLGGNVSEVINTGQQYTIFLESPSNLGLPAGTLAAGSSGIMEFKVKFKCGTNGSGGIPAAGTTVNLTQYPTFTVTGVSNTAPFLLDVTVPTVSACNPPQVNSPSLNKQAGKGVIGQNMYLYWNINVPATSNAVTFTDIFPSGFKLTQALYPGSSFPSGWVVEVQANGTWYNITSYSSVRNWINTVSNGQQLSDQSATPIPNVTRVDVSIPNNLWFDPNYAEGVTGIRFTSPSGGDNAKNFYVYTYTPFSTPVGWYQNCLSSSNVAWTTECRDVYVTDRGSLIHGCWFQPGSQALGGTDLSTAEGGFVSNNYPNLYKDPLDLQGIIKTLQSIKTTSVDAPTFEVLLPDGFDFIQGGNTPNYWVIEHQELAAFNPASALQPVFSKIDNYNNTGRVLLRWDFPNLVYPQNGPHFINDDKVKLAVYFSTRYMGTVPLPTVGNVEAYSEVHTNSVMTMTSGGSGYTGTPTQTLGCTMLYGPPSSGGSINSEKYVQGSLDVQQSRYPISGNTDTVGNAVYELYVHNHSFEGVKQLDIVDLLPYVGDKEMLSTTNRESDWSEEILTDITVERYKIGTGLVNASGNIPNGVLYSYSGNPCYLDGVLPAGQVTADTVLADFGQNANCEDFISTSADRTRSFAFRWQNTGDPLVFGEYLKITVPVRQLRWETDAANNEVAWNSFAYTAVQADDDVLFSSEPLKVGVKMVDMVNKANFCGTVWKDENGNGQRDGGEQLFHGVKVALYDGSQNPVTETVTVSGVSTTIQITAMTDSTGHYCFYGLDPNSTYYVRLEDSTDFYGGGLLEGLTLTTKDAAGVSDTEDSDAELGTLTGSSIIPRPKITITTGAAGSTTDYFDFGFYQLRSIGNYVWQDDDAAGDQDAGEPSVADVYLHLYQSDGFLLKRDTTDVSGRYLFEDIPPGDYYIEVLNLPAGKIPTLKGVTGDNETDSDFNQNLKTDIFTLTSETDRGDIDLGLRADITNPASICGNVWDDFDEDGVFDFGEGDVANVTVQLLDGFGFVISQTQTDEFGAYCFLNLAPNNAYQIYFPLPSITGSSYTNAGADMDANTTTGLTAQMTPINNQNIADIDCGIIGPFSIGNLVWSDTDNDGIKDASESAFSGVTLYLLDGTGSTYLDTTVTDAYGKYVFKNLVQGSYIVELELPNNTRSSTDVANTGTPNAADNDDNGIGTASTGRIQSAVLTLQQGGGTSGSANWTETDHGESINGEFDPATNPKAYYTMDFGLKIITPEICGDGLDNDADGLTDCADPDCGMVNITNVTVGSCINQPLADIAYLDVTISWASGGPSDIIEVSIDGKTEYIDTASVTSPTTIRFNVPADGSTNNNITVNYRNIPCTTTSTYNAPAACSNDQIGCSILYLCGDFKGADADAFDHGLMQYIDQNNGDAILKGAITQSGGSGFNMYDPNSPSTPITFDIDTFDMILVSNSVTYRMNNNLITALANTPANVLNMNDDILDEMGMAPTHDFDWGGTVYTDNSNSVYLYNFNNIDPANDDYTSWGNYLTGIADVYLWQDAGDQAADQKGVFFHYEATDALTGIPATHGTRTHLGYTVDGVYANVYNLGTTPVPASGWLDPIKHLTTEGKLYLDQALALATASCSVEICNNGIDDDGDGLVDLADPDCSCLSGQNPIWLIDEQVDPANLHLWSFTDYTDANSGIDYGRLKYFDPSTSTIRDAGDANDMEAMAVNPYTGMGYFFSTSRSNNGPSGSQALFQYDLNEANNNIGNIVLTLIGHITKPSGHGMESLAYDPMTNRFYTADPKDSDGGSSTSVDDLYYIDLSSLNANPLVTTAPTLVGPISGAGQTNTYVDGLEFDDSGNLYAVDGADESLQQINPATGAIISVIEPFIGTGTGYTDVDIETITWDEVGQQMIALDNKGGHEELILIDMTQPGNNSILMSYLDAPGMPSTADMEGSAMFNNCADRLSIGNLVFNDANTNNTYNSGEGVDGVVVELYQAGVNPAIATPLLKDTTSGGGFYLFENLTAGDYFVHIPSSEFGGGAPLENLVSITGSGGDNQTDNDDNGVDVGTLTTTGISSNTITLTDNGEPTNGTSETGAGNTMDDADDNNGDMTVDFGFASAAEICNNGIDDDGDGYIDCADSDCPACQLPEVEFCTYNLEVIYNETFNIRDYVHVKNSSQAVDWNEVYFTYTLVGANNPTVPSDWNLANFNAGNNVTVTAADAAAGTGNSGNGRYRIYIARYGQPTYDDHMEIRVQNSSSTIISSKCEICIDGIDNNGDGFIDCTDTDCQPVISNVASTNSSCPLGTNNGTITVTASVPSGILEYRLNSGAYQSSNTFTGLAPGTYTITVRKISTPCTATSTATLAVPSCVEICNDGIDNDGDGLIDCADSDCAPVITNVAVTQPTCANKTGGQITITATGIGTLEYSIANEPNWQASNTFSNLGIGQYTIRVRNDSGCETTYTNNPIILDFGTCTEICNNGIDDDGDGKIDCDDPDCDDVGTAPGINKN